MDRFESAAKVGRVGIVANIFLFFIKIFIGYISKSHAMIADAFNSAGDIFASLMTAIGNKIAREPKDENHNFGHGKAEYIFSMFISISMMAVSAKLIIDSANSIIEKNEIIFSCFLIAVCITTVITKFSLYLYTKNQYKKHNNLLIKSNMIDHRNDCLLTTASFVAIILSTVGINWFDGVVGMFISGWIFVAGIGIFKESYNILMDTSLDSNTNLKIKNIILKNKRVLGVGKVYSVPVGCNYVIVVTIFVKGNMTTIESHAITDELIDSITSEIDNLEKVVIHVEPFIKNI